MLCRSICLEDVALSSIDVEVGGACSAAEVDLDDGSSDWVLVWLDVTSLTAGVSGCVWVWVILGLVVVVMWGLVGMGVGVDVIVVVV